MSSDFASFWIRVEAESSQAEAVIARAEQQAERVGAKISTVLSRTAYLASTLGSFSLTMLDLAGVAVDETIEALYRIMLSWTTQMIALAGAQAASGNMVAAALLTSAMAAYQAKATLEQAQAREEARDHLDKARRATEEILSFSSTLTSTVGRW